MRVGIEIALRVGTIKVSEVERDWEKWIGS